VLTFEIVSLKLPYDDKSREEITDLVRERFKVSKKKEKRGVSAAQQEAEWLDDHPLPERRPDLDKVQSGCHPALLECMENWWSDKPDERPFFPDIVEFLKKLHEGRPYWGQGGDDERIVLPDGKEKESVIAAFRRTLGPVRVTVAKVERLQKKNLWDHFAAMRQTMLQRQAASDNYERSWLFHGTSEDSMNKIVAHGFNRIFGYKEVNRKAMTIYGKGVYFAVNSKYSIDYTSPNSSGERHMFLCRVLVGEYCLGREDQPTPDVRRGTELYDSTVNNLEAPTIFVTYHDSQSYPEYIVTFTKQ
jgi:poly [ADP-ribose] polymerase 10/14/15